MLSFTGSLKVLLAVEPCDLRKSFNGLHGLATERLGEDPRQGALFVFTNRRRTRLKMLCWDGTGLWVLSKRFWRNGDAFPGRKIWRPDRPSWRWRRRPWRC